MMAKLTCIAGKRPWVLFSMGASALLLFLSCGLTNDAGEDEAAVGGDSDSGGFCAPTCLKDCSDDNDCDVARGELCCDFASDGKACVRAAYCPRWCDNDTECETDVGQACGPVLVSRERKVCTSPAMVRRRCSNDSACDTGEKCCTIYDDPVCLPANLCPASCSSGSDCNSALGEICCKTFDEVDDGLAAEGLCVHPSASCPTTCEQSVDCNTQIGEICCDGVCSASCAKSCESSNDCPNELCCHSQVARSPFVVGERVGYPVTPAPVVTTPPTPPPVTPTCDNTCIYPYDGYCDDGGPNAVTQVCAFGTDCADCGER